MGGITGVFYFSAMKQDIKNNIDTIFSSTFYEVYDLNIQYVLTLVQDILGECHITEKLKQNGNISIEKLIRELNFSLQAKVPLGWMLNFAIENGLLGRVGKGRTARYYVTSLNFNKDHIYNRILDLDAGFKPSLDLMALVSRHYGSFLKGNKKGTEILFSSEGMNLWKEYFNNKFSGYRVFNVLGANVVSDLLRFKKSIAMLELGGGTGGATEVLFDCLNGAGLLCQVKKYIFSDISPLFVRMKDKKYLVGEFRGLNYSSRRIDFDLPLTEQGIAQDSIDIVYGVNALHVAKDLVFTLGNIKQILKRDGILIISELIRDGHKMLFQEIIFCLLGSYSDVKLNKKFRPLPGFLSDVGWVEAFKEAGFVNIKMINNVAAKESRKKICLVIYGVK